MTTSYDELREALADTLDRETDLHRRIRYLEKQNRKLTDRLNLFRNMMPGRKRLITLGRIAAMMEYEADEVSERIASCEPSAMSNAVSKIDQLYATAYRSDALFLRRLEWDFEQLVDVVWEPKQDRHVWPRP